MTIWGVILLLIPFISLFTASITLLCGGVIESWMFPTAIILSLAIGYMLQRAYDCKASATLHSSVVVILSLLFSLLIGYHIRPQLRRQHLSSRSHQPPDTRVEPLLCARCANIAVGGTLCQVVRDCGKYDFYLFQSYRVWQGCQPTAYPIINIHYSEFPAS